MNALKAFPEFRDPRIDQLAWGFAGRGFVFGRDVPAPLAVYPPCRAKPRQNDKFRR
jgi:hypothetical protein